MKQQFNLMGVREVCEYLSVSKQYVHQLVGEEKLKPIATLHCGRIFLKEDIENFNKTRKKTISSSN